METRYQQLLRGLTLLALVVRLAIAMVAALRHPCGSQQTTDLSLLEFLHLSPLELRGHRNDSVADPADFEFRPTVDVQALQQLRCIGSDYFDLAERTDIDQADRRAHAPHFGRGVAITLGPFPLSGVQPVCATFDFTRPSVRRQPASTVRERIGRAAAGAGWR